MSTKKKTKHDEGVEDVTGQLDLTREYLEGLVIHAQNGDVEAARTVLDEFSSAIEQITSLKKPEPAWSGPIPWPLAKYLAEAFRRILSGAPPEKALNLVGKTQGRRKGKTVTHNMEALAAAFHLLTRAQLREDGSVVGGLSVGEANRQLQEKIGADQTTVYRARRQNEAFAHRALIDDETLKAIATQYAAELKAILDEAPASSCRKSR